MRDCKKIFRPAKNNELKEGQWFDEGRIEVVGPGVSISEVRGELRVDHR